MPPAHSRRAHRRNISTYSSRIGMLLLLFARRYLRRRAFACSTLASLANTGSRNFSKRFEPPEAVRHTQVAGEHRA